MHRLEHFPPFDTFESKDLGDSKRYVLMRAALLSELVQVPIVQQAFARWGKQTGLSARAETYARAGDCLAKALGVSDRFMLGQQAGKLDLSTLPVATRRLITKREKAGAQLRERLLGLSKGVYQDSLNVAKACGAPYPFVAQGLLHGFILFVGAIAEGTEFTVLLRLTPTPLNVTSSTSVREFRALRAATQQEGGRGPRAMQRPDLKKPRTSAETVQRMAQWFVQHKTLNVSISALASRSGCARQNVQAGIRKVKRLLGQSRFDS